MVRALNVPLASMMVSATLALGCGAEEEGAAIKVKVAWGDGTPQQGVTVFATGLSGGDQTRVTDANGEVIFDVAEGMADITAYWRYLDDLSDPEVPRENLVVRTISSVAAGEQVTVRYYNKVEVVEQFSLISGEVVNLDPAFPETKTCVAVSSPRWLGTTLEEPATEVEFTVEGVLTPESIAFASQIAAEDVDERACSAMPLRLGFLPSVEASGNVLSLDVPFDTTINVQMTDVDEEMDSTDHSEGIVLATGSSLSLSEPSRALDDPDSGLLHVPASLEPFGDATLRVYAAATGPGCLQGQSVSMDVPSDVTVALPPLPDVELDEAALRDGDPSGEVVRIAGASPSASIGASYASAWIGSGPSRYLAWSVVQRDGGSGEVRFPTLPLPQGEFAIPEGYSEEFTVVVGSALSGEEAEVHSYLTELGDEPEALGEAYRFLVYLP